ncbi:MAG: SGNH/GDSL hydrolase family protein, partial [Polyangiaceae bacterium]
MAPPGWWSRRNLAVGAYVLRGLAALLVVELALRILLPVPLFLPALRHGPAGARIMMLGRVRHDAFALSGKALDPELGWTNPPGATYVEGTTTHATSQHLRGTRLYPLEKPPGVTRIEVFGDSFAFGSEVDDDSCYAAQLEKRLPSTEVLDFGVPGYGLDQALLRFRKEGPAYHPDVVVIGYVSTLPARDSEPFTFFYKPYFVLRGGQLVLLGTPVPGFAEGMKAYAHSSRLVDVWRMLRYSGRADEALERALLAEFVTEIRAAGARPVL